MLKDKTIVIGVTGSIAAYKAASLVSGLIKKGADVHVIMTEHATKIIHPITFETLTRHKCLIDPFDRNFNYNIEHVALAKKADLFMVAPATANTLAKLANGMADDMLSTTFLACESKKYVVPAMNTAMYENPMTQDNLKKLESYGVCVLEPASGHLACGDEGKGKMPEPEELLEEIEYAIGREPRLAGKNVLITAGPTREAIDPVRFISNRSTGKMGYALAKVAAGLGAEVTLVTGPTTIKKPKHVKIVDVESAAEMMEAVKERYQEQDIMILSAAVADFTPANPADQKIKKTQSDGKIVCEKTEDILAFLGKNRKEGVFLCGFSMETENLAANSREKLQKKGADMIVANSLRQAGAGFGVDTNIVTLITNESARECPIMSKEDVAEEIFKEIEDRLLHSI